MNNYLYLLRKDAGNRESQSDPIAAIVRGPVDLHFVEPRCAGMGQTPGARRCAYPKVRASRRDTADAHPCSTRRDVGLLCVGCVTAVLAYLWVRVAPCSCPTRKTPTSRPNRLARAGSGQAQNQVLRFGRLPWIHRELVIERAVSGSRPDRSFLRGLGVV